MKVDRVPSRAVRAAERFEHPGVGRGSGKALGGAVEAAFQAEVGALLSTGRECVPSLSERIGRLSAFWGSEHERWAVRQAYALAPTANFSRAILEVSAQPLAVLKMPGLTWCDLGSPDRVLKTLAECRIEVPALGGGAHLGQGGRTRWHP